MANKTAWCPDYKLPFPPETEEWKYSPHPPRGAGAEATLDGSREPTH